MTSPTWSAGGVTVRPVFQHDQRFGLTVTIDRRTAVLAPTLAASLRDWLAWQLDGHDDTPAPADPDRVRLAIDEQRAALAERSMDASENFRAGLAWADNALNAIARAAGGAP